MLADDQKYLSDVFKLAGFALMTPIGKVVLNLSDLKPFSLNTRSVCILLFLMLLFYFGIITLYEGYKTTREGK